MRGLVAQMMSYIGQRLWPPGPPPPETNPQAEEHRKEADQIEKEVRAELVRAQTEALRFRALTGRD